MPETLNSTAVYTIRHPSQLAIAARTSPSSPISEGKRWTTAAALVASSEPRSVPVLFADARDTSAIFAWARLDTVALVDAGTQFTFVDLRYIDRLRKTHLRLVSNKQRLSAGYIRPYALVETPAVLKSDSNGPTSRPELDRLTTEAVALAFPQAIRSPRRFTAVVEAYSRSPEIRAWVLRNASGRCEGCGCEAPFLDDRGIPFLEVHHLTPLSCGGEDSVENAAALCPNCHRAMHFAADRHSRTELVRNRRLNSVARAAHEQSLCAGGHGTSLREDP